MFDGLYMFIPPIDGGGWFMIVLTTLDLVIEWESSSESSDLPEPWNPWEPSTSHS